MTDHKAGLMIHENRAFVERAAWYAVCVINVSAAIDRQRRIISDEIGTGTACTWEGQRLILTARHVVGKAQPKDVEFLLRVGEAIDWDSKGRTGFASKVSLPIEKIIRSDDEDLAAIVLKPDGLENFNIRFCELPKKLARSRTTKKDGVLFLIGYPSDQTFEVSELRTHNAETKFIACVPNVLTGAIAQAPEYPLPSSYNPDEHVLIRFDPRSPDLKPHGYSGAGAWCEAAERLGTLWTAEPMLFGVQTEAFLVRSRLLKAVGAPAIRTFLEKSF